MDLIELCEKQPGLKELLGSFNDQNVSDYVVVYLRLLTSGYLQREHGFFQHFIEGGRSVKEFYQQVRPDLKMVNISATKSYILTPLLVAE